MKNGTDFMKKIEPGGVSDRVTGPIT